MISHKHKIIFIHIPKCAGSSVNDYYFDNPNLDWRKPNYELLYGWCPKRKIHLQHATSKQLIETELVSVKQWETYFKFTFVRNPWDRAYSDYLWIMNDSKVHGSFKEYILKKGAFRSILTDQSTMNYRGDHLLPQTEFFTYNGKNKLDFVGRFESLYEDINFINERINISKPFEIHKKKNTKRINHYSEFYTNSKKILVDEKYKLDIEQLNYYFEDKRSGFYLLKKYL